MQARRILTAGSGGMGGTDSWSTATRSSERRLFGRQPRCRWPGSRGGRVVLRGGSVFNYASDASA